MTCSEDKERLSAWRDGELAEAERAAVSAHLSACAECRAVVEAYEAIGRELAASPRIAAPPSILEGVRRGTGNVVPFRRPALLPFSIAAAAALLIAVNIAVFFSVNSKEPPTPTAAAPASYRDQADEAVSRDGASAEAVAPSPVLILARVDDKERKAADAVTGRLRELEQRRNAEGRDRQPAQGQHLAGLAAGTVYEVELTQQEYDGLKKLATDQGLVVEERADDTVWGYADGGALKKEDLARGLAARSAPARDAPAPSAPGAEKGGGRTVRTGGKLVEELEAAKPKAAAPARFRVRVLLIEAPK